MTKYPQLANQAFQALQEKKAIAKTFEMACGRLEQKFLWLQASPDGFEILEQSLDDKGLGKENIAHVLDVKREKLSDILQSQARSAESLLAPLLESFGLNSIAELWPVTVLAQAQLPQGRLIVGKGLGSLAPSDYFMAVARPDAPFDLCGHRIPTDALLLAFERHEPIFLTAFDESPEALKAACELDAELFALLEASELEVASTAIRMTMPPKPVRPGL